MVITNLVTSGMDKLFRNLVSILLITLLTLSDSAAKIQVHIPCPLDCICNNTSIGKNTGITVNCQSKKLKTVPNLQMLTPFTIQLLNLRNNSLGNLTSDTFIDLEIRELDISDNTFNEISDNALLPLNDSLHILRCDNLGLDLNKLDFLSTLPSLHHLSLRGNVITNTTVLRRFPSINLLSLDISHNKLIQIENEALVGVRESLEIMVLDNTGISFQDLSFLNNFTQLKRLSMNKVNQTHLVFYGNVFKPLNLQRLTALSIGHCGLMQLNPNTFSGIEYIEELYLSYNNFKFIPSHAFLYLSKLKKLDLSFNTGITYILDKAFYSLESIQHIDMRGTSVDLIHSGAFMGTEDSLEELLLSHCRLPEKSSFLVDAFTRLTSLKRLDLSYNALVHIYNETFVYMTSLMKLDLSGNLINFTDTMFSGLELSLKFLRIRNMGLNRLPTETLSILEYLETVDATGNNFKNISLNFFQGLKAKNIILSECNISNIDVNALHSFPYINHLNLNDNNITNLDFVSGLHKCFIHTLSVRDNPIHCRCATVSALQRATCGTTTGQCININMTSVTEFSYISNVLRCHGNRCEPSFLICVVIIIMALESSFRSFLKYI